MEQEQNIILDAEFVNYTAQNIMEIIRSAGTIALSWGATSFKATVYKGMAAVKFSVNGFVHKGIVVIAYNEGADLYEVYCLQQGGQVVSSQVGVYFDQLMSIIDEMVEKDCSDSQYNDKCRRWLRKI